jgi:hypothetical protein
MVQVRGAAHPAVVITHAKPNAISLAPIACRTPTAPLLSEYSRQSSQHDKCGALIWIKADAIAPWTMMSGGQ